MILQYLTSKDPDTGQYPLKAYRCQTAFKRGCSAYENASRHADYAVSVKFDIRKFFDSIPATEARATSILRFFHIKKQVANKERQKKLAAKAAAAANKPQSKQVQRYRSGYSTIVTSVVQVLAEAGIDHDIAKLIADVSSFKGYLYQGSPLSPVLANAVTARVLVPRLLKLAKHYTLPVLQIKGSKFLVAAPATHEYWHTGFDENDPDLKYVIDTLSQSTTQFQVHRVVTPRIKIAVGSKISCTHMQPLPDEDVDQMVLRYANKAWVHGVPKLTTTLKDVLAYTGKRRQARRQRERAAESAEPPSKPRGSPWLDVRVWHKAKTVFTLYADDGMFSSNNNALHRIRHVLRRIVEDCGFSVNSKKGIRVMRSSRYVTGYEVSKAPEGTLDPGARLGYKHRDAEYRRPLHYMKCGKVPITEEVVNQFNGKLAYLKQSNENSWKRYAREFRDVVRASTSNQEILKMVERYGAL